MNGSSSSPHQNKPGDVPVRLEKPADAGLDGANMEWGAHDVAEHSRSLCIAVDDFGLHAGVCEAALQLALHGRTQAISCMVGAPAWAQWAPQLRGLDPCQTETGLHLDLTQHPILLRPQGLGPLIVLSWLRALDCTQIRTEIRAQLDAFEHHSGQPPAYVDGHQHIHQFPVVRDELLTQLQNRYAGCLPWLRNTAGYGGAGPQPPVRPWREALKPWLLETLGAAALARKAKAQGFRQNGHLLGVYNFTGGEENYARRARDWLAASRSGDLWMCHPSVGNHPQDPLAQARQHEYRVLSGDALGALLREEGIRLEPLGQTLQRGAASGGCDCFPTGGHTPRR